MLRLTLYRSPAFPPTTLRLTKYYVAAPENTISRMYHRVPCTTTSLSLVSVYVHVRAEARHRSSIDPKRIRGKRARRWINTKTSVTHDQAEPSSAISSCFALAQTSPCAAVAFFSTYMYTYMRVCIYVYICVYFFYSRSCFFVFLSAFLSCTQRFVRDAYIGIVYILQDVHLDQ